jgi:hypothetical protein
MSEVLKPYRPIPPKRTRKPGFNRPSALTQALDMRDKAAELAIDIANAQADTLADKRARAQGLRDCNTVWDTSCDRARVLRGKPMPGSLKPESPKAKRRVASVVEPTEMP